MIHFRTRKLLATFLTAVAALIVLPALAQADSRHRDRHDHRAHGVRLDRHGAHCASRHAHPTAFRRPSHAHPYHCRRCARSFGSWSGLRQHAQHHHGVASWHLSRLLVRSGPFWIFVG